MEDLNLLTQHFVKKFSGQYEKQISGLTPRAQILLARHPWPGNVRELENVIGHACMMAMGNVIDVADLPEHLRRSPGVEPSSSDEASSEGPGYAMASQAARGDAGAHLSFEEHEKNLVKSALEKATGNQSEAARQLRIGRDALRYKMKKYGLL